MAKINKIKLFIWKSHRKFVGTRGDFKYSIQYKPQDIIYKQSFLHRHLQFNCIERSYQKKKLFRKWRVSDSMNYNGSDLLETREILTSQFKRFYFQVHLFVLKCKKKISIEIYYWFTIQYKQARASLRLRHKQVEVKKKTFSIFF